MKKSERKNKDGQNEKIAKSRISASDDKGTVNVHDAVELSDKPGTKRVKKVHHASLHALTHPTFMDSKEEQVEWLKSSYKSYCGASDLECEALINVLMLPNSGSLEDRLKAVEPDWEALFIHNASIRSKDSVHGAPVGMFVSPAATSCLSMIRDCPQFRKACPIAKLFAKHMKLEEQTNLLNGNQIILAAGTPNRLCKLLEVGALKLDKLRWLVLDVRRDVKQRSLLDTGDVSKDWWVSWERYFRSAVEKGAKIALFSASSAAANANP